MGKGAPDDLISELTRIGEMHHEEVEVDCIRAYHFGSRFMVRTLEGGVFRPASS